MARYYAKVTPNDVSQFLDTTDKKINKLYKTKERLDEGTRIGTLHRNTIHWANEIGLLLKSLDSCDWERSISQGGYYTWLNVIQRDLADYESSYLRPENQKVYLSLVQDIAHLNRGVNKTLEYYRDLCSCAKANR
jgi:hypothetical protein